MPAVEALRERFEAAGTQVLGVSVDSIYCHANWACDLGGISFPLLADFHPKGKTAAAYGLYLEDNGITDRATVILSADGVVRFAESVGPGGERDIEALLARCEAIADEHGRPSWTPPARRLPAGATLYVKSRCGFSRAALLARSNLHLEQSIAIKNVTEDASACEELERIAGKSQAPCLVIDGQPKHESAEIIAMLVEATAPVPT
ncbi:MAG TPA: redoxin domain-containing protein [Acidobacteria bacterium]|nr:redoxin domain-containing protein [Acidobacteriota bacterium]